MKELTIIRDKSELEHTCYIEIVPGKYQYKHWQQGSLFFCEEAFGFIEPIFKSFVGGYSHYSTNDVSKSEWLRIIEGIENLNLVLSSCNEIEDFMLEIDFFFERTRRNFQKNLTENKIQLIAMNKEFISWIRETLKNHDHIAVLGL